MKTKLILLALLAPLIVLAHTDAEPALNQKTTALIVEPDIYVAGVSTPIFLEIKSAASQEKIAGLDVEIEIEDAAEKVIFTDTAQYKNDYYIFEYQFPKGGKYSIHTSFNYQNEEQSFEFNIFAAEAQNMAKSTGIYIALGAGILALATLILGIKKKKIKATIISIVIIFALAGIVYSLYVTLSQDPSLGIVTCTAQDQCFWTAHIHAYVPIEICGKDYRLPIELGSLSGPHTHEEKNIIHWHDKLPYDNDKKIITDIEPLTLGAFFDELDLDFSENSLINKTNGTACANGEIGTLKMFINGVPVIDQFRDYIWKDRDVVNLFFDSRTSAEIEAELKAKPVEFPKLGRG